MLNGINKFRQISNLIFYSCICMDRFGKNSIFRIRSNMAYYITQAMLGQVGLGSTDINKFYRNFSWIKFKVTSQDIQYFCSNKIRIRQSTNETVCEIPLTRGQLCCDHQKLNLLNKTLQGNNTFQLCLFFERNLRFSFYSLLFPLALNLFVRIILF